MSTRRVRRIAFSWLALVAILMVSLAPSVSGLLAASGGIDGGQICSADADVTSGASGTSDTPSGGHVFAHCPYCALHADLAPPPDPLVADAGLLLVFRDLPRAFLAAPHASAVWASAQPRAPPLRG